MNVAWFIFLIKANEIAYINVNRVVFLYQFSF